MTSGLAEAYVAQGLEFVKRMMGVHHLTLGQVCTPQCCDGISSSTSRATAASLHARGGCVGVCGADTKPQYSVSAIGCVAVSPTGSEPWDHALHFHACVSSLAQMVLTGHSLGAHVAAEVCRLVNHEATVGCAPEGAAASASAGVNDACTVALGVHACECVRVACVLCSCA